MKHVPLYISTIALLALFAGSSITIWFIVLPFWHSLPPTELMQWFHDFGPRVGITMLPMEIIPLLLTVAAYRYARKSGADGSRLWLWTTFSNITILIMLAYFLPVNFQFVNQTMDPRDVPAELLRWELLHIVRTILSVISTLLAGLAYFKYSQNFIYLKS